MSTRATDSNYEYVTARVRSRRANLFDEEDYQQLVRMEPSGIARFMEESQYEEEMNALGSRHSGVDLVEHALARNLAKDFEDLLRWASGPLYDDIARYLRKFDAWNIKTVLRGIYADTGRESVENDLVRTGEFDEDRRDRLLEADSIEGVVEGLSDTVFGPPLESALDEYESTGTLVPLENAIDRAYYEELLAVRPGESNARRLYVKFLEAEIDFRNARNALRLARSGADTDPATYFIDGGRLFDESDLAGIADNPDELAARLADSRYGDELDAALDALDDAESLTGFERALDAALAEYAHQLANWYPLSVCPVFAYVLAKEREVDNVRAIARGRAAGLDPETIEEDLVLR
ncbi:V-type ATP synthase subunit C [Halococcus sp. IIIV-5B]|uniref:V-type ATP synthase subunit C n=1 Tax=Halococcus sp. IIIV-5B TaxID=2321230 RepID=UPI000E70A93F|nr:V-type ATP synthase subunit C [Halococcus sp. IIIV-5B]RJT02182.1 V-type ATP synthase subunit C [Halococcus sp. IIIV-5B]